MPLHVPPNSDTGALGLHLSNKALAAARLVVSKLDPSQYAEFFQLVSNARQNIPGSQREWSPFITIFSDANIDPARYEDLTALMMEVLPKLLAHEKQVHQQAVKEARERLAKSGGQAGFVDKSGNFALTTSTASSTSINEGADEYAWAIKKHLRNELGYCLRHYRLTLKDVLECIIREHDEQSSFLLKAALVASLPSPMSLDVTGRRDGGGRGNVRRSRCFRERLTPR